MSELIATYGKKTNKTPAEGQFLKEMGKHLETIERYQRSFTELESAYETGRSANSSEEAETLLRKRSGQKENYVLWFDRDPTQVHLSYQRPGTDEVISTTTPLKDLLPTLNSIKEEFINLATKASVSKRESFSQGQPIRRSVISRPDLASTKPPVSESSLNYSDVRTLGSSSSMIPEANEPASQTVSRVRRSNASRVSVSFQPSKGQTEALENIKKQTRSFASIANNSSDALEMVNERPGAWIFWPDEMKKSQVNFACGQIREIQTTG